LEETHIRCQLNEAVLGDKQARENLIEHLRPFIKNEAQRICRRDLEWGRDDELSIAMIALNEAIDAYREDKNSSFKSFARLVIKRRLVDYFRQNATNYTLPGDEKIIYEASVNVDWEQKDREDEIVKYRSMLRKFNITLEMVARAQPKHRKVKNKLRRVARILSGEKELMEYLYNTGKLPKKRLCNMAGVTSRMLDRGRVYVIALAFLLSREKFPVLREYVCELTGEGEESYEKKSKRDSDGKV